MPIVEVKGRCQDLSADEVFTALCDFARYPEISDAVRSVIISEEGGAAVSSWEVNFRGGVMVWSEYDQMDPENRTIDFTRRGGDPESFEGSWRVSTEGDGCRIDFQADFDLGMPSMADILEPIALRTLYENIVSVIRGVAGSEVEILSRAPE